MKKPSLLNSTIIPRLILILFALLISTHSHFAQSSPRVKHISDIQVTGLKLIDKGLIYSTINSTLGQPVSPVTVSQDIKALHGLGYFKDIAVEVKELEGDKIQLIFLVQEKPRVSLISFEGNTLFDDSSFKDKLVTYVNNMVSLKKIRSDMRMIRDEYRKKGRLQTQVSYRLNRVSDAYVALTYVIEEAPSVYLTDITVTGTKFFFPIDIKRIMQSSEIDCYSSITDSGVFQESKVNIDQQIILQTYLQNGFIKVQIDKPKIVLVRKRDYNIVKIGLNIHEGKQYKTGNVYFVSTDGKDLLFDAEEMREKLKLKKGSIYNPFFQNQDRFKLNDLYSTRGYAFSRVRVQSNINEKTQTVDLTYHLTRGEKAYLGRIEIIGNYETQDKVVRRELAIHENELYNGAKIRESQQNIGRLGFFATGSGVRFKKDIDAENEVLDYQVKLQETQTGTFSGSISYAGNSGASLQLSVSKKNLFGTGQSATISTTQYAKGESRYNVSLTTPYWMETQFTRTVSAYSLFDEDSDTDDYAYYDKRTTGGAYGLSYPIWKNWRLSSTYAYKGVNYSNIGEDGLNILGSKTKDIYSSLTLGLQYSTVNNPMFPTDGFEASTNIEQYGEALGGTVDFREYNFLSRYFKSLNQNKTVVFMAKYTYGHLEKTGSGDIPVDQRYKIGGITSVRGHDWYDIEGGSSHYDIRDSHPYQGDYSCNNANPADDDAECATVPAEMDETREYWNNHTGGITKQILNLELLFPLTREGQNIRGVVFFDAGNVWSEDEMYEISGENNDRWKFRKSAGLGARIVTPMGVLRFEYGMKLDKEEGESSGKFDFHISGLF